MSIKDDMRRAAGVINEDTYNSLNEGIVFFKNSGRLRNFVKVIDRKITEIQATSRPSVKADVDALNELKTVCLSAINKFEEIENKFKAAKKEDRSKLKNEYKQLELEFGKIMAVAKKRDVQVVLMRAGMAVMFVASILSTAFFIKSIFMFIEGVGEAFTGVESWKDIPQVDNTIIAKPIALMAGTSLLGALSRNIIETFKEKLNRFKFADDAFDLIQEMKVKEAEEKAKEKKVNEDVVEESDRREWKRAMREYRSEKMADYTVAENRKAKKRITVLRTIEYMKTNPKFAEALKKFYGDKFSEELVRGKRFYYDKIKNEVMPCSWDD